MSDNGHFARDLGLLEEIERNPDVTQAGMATRLGVAVGTVNWHLKRLIAKGYIKVKRAERRKLRYIITPEGISLRAKLTVAYIENSMTLYRQIRDEAKAALEDAIEQGIHNIMLEGEGDIADVWKLTCLELGLHVVDNGNETRTAIIHIDGQKVRLDLGQTELKASHEKENPVR